MVGDAGARDWSDGLAPGSGPSLVICTTSSDEVESELESLRSWLPVLSARTSSPAICLAFARFFLWFRLTFGGGAIDDDEAS